MPQKSMGGMLDINMFVGVAVGFGMLASFSSVLSNFIGIDPIIARLAGVLLFAITVTLGGLSGAAITGTIQAVVVIGGALAISITAFLQLVSGLPSAG